MLRGTSLHAVTVQWKAQVDGDFGELEELQLSSPWEDGCSTVRDALGGALTKEGYLWALGTVRAASLDTIKECRGTKHFRAVPTACLVHVMCGE